MHVHMRRAGAALLLAAAGAMVPASCVTNESSLFIRGCIDVDRSTCIAEAQETATLKLRGFIDGAYAPQYSCFALVENQLVQRGDANKLRVETSRVSLYEADIQILNTNMQVISTTAGPAQFTVPVTGFVDPATGTTPGLGISSVIMLDAGTVRGLATQAASSGTIQQVVASVIIRGRTLGGLEVHTNEFLYPIDVCSACSCSLPPEQICSSATNPPDPDCRLGLDQNVDCRLLDACRFLSCTTPGDVSTATCPANGVADGSCCP